MSTLRKEEKDLLRESYLGLKKSMDSLRSIIIREFDIYELVQLGLIPEAIIKYRNENEVTILEAKRSVEKMKNRIITPL